MKLTPILLLYFGLAITTLGMIFVVLGVLSGGLFLPGVVLLLIGQLIIAAAGVFGSVRSPVEPA